MAPLQPEEHQKQLISAAGYAVHAVGLALALYSAPLYWKQDYHTSRLSGAEWVDELIRGHPDQIWTELGMRLHVFLALVHELRLLGMKDGRTVGVNPGQPQDNEFGNLANGAVTRSEKTRATAARNQIVEAMWRDYQ